jgi:N-acyl amino acid synthase FeeM
VRARATLTSTCGREAASRTTGGFEWLPARQHQQGEHTTPQAWGVTNRECKYDFRSGQTIVPSATKRKVHQADLGSDNPAVSNHRLAQLSDFSERVTGRLARSYAERDAIFKLRYQSYLHAALIPQNAFGRYIEPSDHADNSYLMGLHVDRRLIGCLRLQVGRATSSDFSALQLFPHVLQPLLRGGKTLVHMSCVATHAELARSNVWLPYVILRAWIVAAEHFHADYIAAAIAPQHRLFYRRLLGCDLHAGNRPHPHHFAPMGLVTLDFAASAARIYENLPFLRSTRSERQQLFAPEAMPSRVAALNPSVL